MNSSFVMIIFGATGDLARNKLIPALFSLYKQKQLGRNFSIVGFARRLFTDEEFRNMFQKFSADSQWDEFSKNLFYQQGMFDQEAGYKKLIQKLEEFDKQEGECIARLFYLATPPDNYEMILNFLDSTKLFEDRCSRSFREKFHLDKQNCNKWTKIIIEKPFGKNLKTAQMLDKKLAQLFEEKQIFRVDHYLGKETVQNILTFRFANGIFEPVWNKNFIDHVQITWGEIKGIEGRGTFFDGVGLLRDVAQNHLLQFVAAVSMEQPKNFSKEGVRDARAGAIQAIQCIEPDQVAQNVVRAQYEKYKDEKDVASDSKTETFVAMKFFVDTPRFSGVPFYIRSGKKVPKNTAEISIVFIQTCHILFKEFGCPEIGNVLTIRIQPDEGINLRVIVKKPGAKVTLDMANMHFSYANEFGEAGADAYEKLLVDILTGDQMLFNRSDELASSWTFITKILDGWKNDQSAIKTYQQDSWGPKEADELIEKDGRKWL